MGKIQNISDLEVKFIDESCSRISLEKSPDFSLANYRDFVIRSNNYFRNILYAMRNEGKSIMTSKEREKWLHEDKKPNVEFCGLNMKWNTEFIDLVKTEFDTLAYRGLAQCGLVWRCPICSMKILQGRQDQLYEYVSLHQEQKREVGFITLTIPHEKSDSLEKTLNKLNDNYRRFQMGRWFQSQKTSILGQVKALEITYGNVHGWHPHLHILYFYNDISKKEIRNIQKEVVGRWVDFRDNNANIRGQDEKLAYDNDIADYMSKWDIIKEVTAENVKYGKGTTPFQILKKLAIKDYKTPNMRHFYFHKFKEYAEYTKGKHRLSISQKLIKAYPEVKNKTDEQLVKDVKIEDVLVKFQYIIWLQIARKKLQPHVINTYLKAGFQGVTDLLNLYNIDFDVQFDSEDKPIIR